jgi:hypothetical protein
MPWSRISGTKSGIIKGSTDGLWMNFSPSNVGAFGIHWQRYSITDISVNSTYIGVFKYKKVTQAR